MMIKLMARFLNHDKKRHFKIKEFVITKFEEECLEFETGRIRWHALTSP
jgi:hypothetical protein